MHDEATEGEDTCEYEQTVLSHRNGTKRYKNDNGEEDDEGASSTSIPIRSIDKSWSESDQQGDEKNILGFSQKLPREHETGQTEY